MSGSSERFRLLGTLAAVALIAACPVAPAAGSNAAEEGEKSDPVERLAGAAMRRGLDWLKGKQRPDGSWSNSNFPALTALGLWAFARSDHPDRAAVCGKAASAWTSRWRVSAAGRSTP